MSDDFQQLIEDSKTLVEALKRKGAYDGFMNLLTELYPDNAHFIYELLQNAEDTSATEVCFILNDNNLVFKHNGENLFSFDNVKSITNIGVSTKRDEHTQIGKFGVGFKSVFAYTDTPEIESGQYHFRIRDMVVPDITNLPPRNTHERETRFVFPFNNPKKSPEKARVEIEKNLRQLGESTLLFLSHIRKIEYHLPNSESGYLERKDSENNLIGIIAKHPEEGNILPSVYLRFEKSVNVKDEKGDVKSCRIAVAFKLKRVQEQGTKKLSGAENPRFKIEPTTGQVSIYFPAEKETSNLRFHLHAPFASTVARDSVRDCPANNQLRDHLANLIAESMLVIRDQELLTMEFLGALPNDKDNLPAFYKPIQNKLIEVFKKENLTPMKMGGHAPASKIFKSVPAQLSDLVDDEDLAQILGKEYQSPLWVKNPPQRNQREDNFLSMLGVADWATKDLFEKTVSRPEFASKWMSTKTDEWHQQFYALLGDFLSDAPQYYDPLNRKDKLSKLPIVRISDGTYRPGISSFFPSDEVENDKSMPRVAKGVYTSSKSEKDQKKAKEFLKTIGVREVGEAEEIEAILKGKYLTHSHGFEEEEIQHVQRFVSFVEKNPTKADVFKDYFVIKTLDGQWKKPSETYLDSPFSETGLVAYFGSINNKKIKPLSLSYQKCGVKPDSLARFAIAVGSINTLPIRQSSCRNNPEWNLLSTAGGDRYGKGKDNDWHIEELEELLKFPKIEVSTLLWKTMSKISKTYLYAEYQKTEKYGSKKAKSQLVHILKDSAWIPQKNQDASGYAFVKPSEADSKLLPDGFMFDNGWEWLKEVEFGKFPHQHEQLKNVEYQREEEIVKKLGFPSIEDAKEAAEMIKKDPHVFKKLKEQSSKEKPVFPKKNVRDPERRQEHITDQIRSASEKQYETRERSVRTTSGEIDPRSWLRNYYTNESDQMVCQICKEEMPFKGRDGEYYFEAVESLSRDYFSIEREEQFLALCPVCAARYKEFIKRDENAMRDLCNDLKNSDTLVISLKLGKWETSIQFVESHWQDIKTILQKNMR